MDADENDKWDGLSLYTYQENDPAGMWRAIFMASDNGGVGSPEWRTHTPLRMLTANGKTGGDTFQVWFDWNCGSSCGLNGYSPIKFASIKNAFEALAQVTYEAKFEKLKHPISHAPVAGARLTASQQARAVRRHVATVYQSSSWAGGMWPGQTALSRGIPDSPDRSFFASQLIASDSDRPTPHTTEQLAWAQTYVILHELGHAAGLDHHAVTGECVMDDHLKAHLYSSMAVPWFGGSGEHAMDHINGIRRHLNWKEIK